MNTVARERAKYTSREVLPGRAAAPEAQLPGR